MREEDPEGVDVHQRYVNNEILKFISRPQPEVGCSIASLACVINYLYSATIGLKSVEDLSGLLGVADVDDIGRPGHKVSNDKLMYWYGILCKKLLDVRRVCHRFVNREDVTDWSQNELVFTRIRSSVRSRDEILVCHIDGHYNLVCGYYDQAGTVKGANDESNIKYRYLILADHSQPRDPIRSVRWRDVRAEIMQFDKKANKYVDMYCLIRFTNQM